MKNQDKIEYKALEKAPTHIQGLDEILEGGLPRGKTTIGKTEEGFAF